MQGEGEEADGDGGTQLPSPVWDRSLQAGSDYCPGSRYRGGPTSGGELEIFYLLVSKHSLDGESVYKEEKHSLISEMCRQIRSPRKVSL